MTDLEAHRLLTEVQALRAEVGEVRQLLLDRWAGDDELAERRARIAAEALARAGAGVENAKKPAMFKVLR